MNSTRPSILLRPRHQRSRANEETAEPQHAKEQALLELKRQKQAANEYHLRCARGEASVEEKHEVARELLGSQAVQLESRAARERDRKEREARALAVQAEMERQQAEAETARRRERFEANREAMLVNQQMAEAKRRQALEAKRREAALENADLAYQLKR